MRSTPAPIQAVPQNREPPPVTGASGRWRGPGDLPAAGPDAGHFIAARLHGRLPDVPALLGIAGTSSGHAGHRWIRPRRTQSAQRRGYFVSTRFRHGQDSRPHQRDDQTGALRTLGHRLQGRPRYPFDPRGMRARQPRQYFQNRPAGIAFPGGTGKSGGDVSQSFRTVVRPGTTREIPRLAAGRPAYASPQVRPDRFSPGAQREIQSGRVARLSQSPMGPAILAG